jgi:hypothetical protein
MPRRWCGRGASVGAKSTGIAMVCATRDQTEARFCQWTNLYVRIVSVEAAKIMGTKKIAASM